MQFLQELDASILIWIQENLRSPILTPIFQVITSLGNAGIFWILLTLLFLCIPKYRKAGIASAISLIGCLLIINLSIKNLAARIRPYEVIPELELLIAKPSDYSFPSGHTAASIASSFAILFSGRKKEGLTLIILAVLIGFSRLYLGVHYPSDVLGGAAIGFLIALIVCTIIKKKRICT